MRTLAGRRRIPAIGVLLAAISSSAVGCGAGSDAAAEPPAAPHFRAVLFSVDPVSAYSAAMERGARERAAELGIVLDVVRAATGSIQVEQVRDAARSEQYLGGLILPLGHRELCDVSTNLAPDHNFMLAVTDTPICGREGNEGDGTWAPGTLTFVSAGGEIGNVTRWGEHIRTRNAGRQHIVLLSSDSIPGRAGKATAAFQAIEREHPQFDLVQTLITGGTGPDAATQLSAALQDHPETTIVASTSSELTEVAATMIAQQTNDRVRLYDLGGGAEVLKLIDKRRVQMTLPQFPHTMGATAVQALYDARVGRTPIRRYHAVGGRTAPSGPAVTDLLFVTRENLAQFRSAGLSEY